MSAQQPAVTEGGGIVEPPRLWRHRWLVLGAAMVIGVAGGVTIGMLKSAKTQPVSSSSPIRGGPDQTWAAGTKRAPDFSLVDQAGRTVSIASFRGRPVIVTFIDPLCRNLCPLEAKVLGSVESRLPAAQRPVILAVSVNQWGDKRSYLLQDVTKWRLVSQWHWAVGPTPALKKVWGSYSIGVQDSPKTVAGVTVHNISHTEAAYLVDAHGYQRALYLYPFVASDVAKTVQQIAGA